MTFVAMVGERELKDDGDYGNGGDAAGASTADSVLQADVSQSSL